MKAWMYEHDVKALEKQGAVNVRVLIKKEPNDFWIKGNKLVEISIPDQPKPWEGEVYVCDRPIHKALCIQDNCQSNYHEKFRCRKIRVKEVTDE